MVEGHTRDSNTPHERLSIIVEGMVQGVGFRPFIYSLATKHHLTGYVLNDTKGVLIEVEGRPPALQVFLKEVQSNPPSMASVERVTWQGLSPIGEQLFTIIESQTGGERSVLISPDTAPCNDCLEELFDPKDRRFCYPFINCTNCGPRFTIVQDVPYDRMRTTMSVFPMCTECSREYHDPQDRRFHAQPNACAACGPHLTLTDAAGQALEIENPVEAASALLCAGKITAIKGLGGFHLSCDALNEHAVARLRERKYREFKPFAMMVTDLQEIERFCEVSPEEAALLQSPQRPIVLLRKNGDCSLSEAVAPRQNYLGFMLPYTPLHELLLRRIGRPLVMTSGNRSEEPIAYRNGEAVHQLRHIADYFLIHDRDIYMRCDDSVARVWQRQPTTVRRARGYVPQPITIERAFKAEILACGAELKNTFCLTRKNHAFISNHIGDLENFATLQSFTQGIEHCKKLFCLDPEVVAYDLHPDYLSTKYALALENPPRKVGVQHHHAHVASCMADNGLEGEVIGVVFDGLGYGTDGNFWGGEFLTADYHGFIRRAHLCYVPMPGGTKAIKEPWRMAATYLHHTYGPQFLDLDIDFVRRLDKDKWGLLQRMIERRLNSPLTSGVGRLFDAVSSLLGVRDVAHYEGQAAIELEMISAGDHEVSYPLEFDDTRESIDVSSMIRSIVHDLVTKVDTAVIAAKFHNTLATLIVRVADGIRREYSLRRVVLSGGVFQNMFLLENTLRLLERHGFEVYFHHRVPANDGGISLGQALIANAALQN